MTLGRLYLTQHEFDKAIDQFEKALALGDKNAQLHNDYGVALMEKGKAERLKNEDGKSLEGFARALEHLSKAIELDASLLEALFNRALCRQEMTLYQQAEEDWRLYLEKDPNSKWADEVKQNLKRLEEQKQNKAQIKERILDEFLSAYQLKDDQKAWEIIIRNREAVSGKPIFEQLLSSYLDSSIKRLNDADSKLQALSYVANLEARRTGDCYALDLMSFYGSTSAAQQLALAQAREMMDEGNRNYISSSLDKAIDSYSKARNLFYRAGNSCEVSYAEYRLGRCYLETTRAQQSLELLQRLARVCEERNHQWLLAQVFNLLGSVHAFFNEYSTAIEYTGRALEISERLQDAYSKQKNLAQMANEYKSVGNYRQALACLQKGLSSATLSWSSARQMWRNYDTTARIFTLMRFYAAAADYGREALQLSLENKDPSLIYVSYVHLGAVYGKLQNYAEAIRHTELGFEIAQSFSSRPDGLDMMAYSSLQLGHLKREATDFDQAIRDYDRAIQLNYDLKHQGDLYEAHKGKLLCYIAQKNDALAKQELQTTLSLFEQYRSKIQEESNRNTFSDNQQSIYDVAIDFEYSRMNDRQKAFEYSETSRARSLLDLTSANARLIRRRSNPELLLQFDSKPVDLDGLKKKIPPQTQVLEYTVLNDKLLIWVFSQTDFFVTEKAISLARLSEEVFSFLRLVSRADQGKREEMLRTATALYDILIGPVETKLDSRKLLCVIPDKVLNYLPFSALVSPSSGNYLVSDYLMTFCPSSNIFLVCSDRARIRGGQKVEKVLSVGNPRFDAQKFPSYSELSSAAEEAKAVAGFYSSSSFLIGDDAKEARVRSEMEKSDIIHLASHYIVDEQSPMLSRLLLAKEPAKSVDEDEPDGVLQAYEIYRLKLQSARLVVLSACRTGVEGYYNGEGMIGMSRTFIAMGVPLVVASLWAVDSKSSAKLMTDFHRYRKFGAFEGEGPRTVEALRQAQLEMANGPEPRYQHPYYWAPFVAIGGYANY